MSFVYPRRSVQSAHIVHPGAVNRLLLKRYRTRLVPKQGTQNEYHIIQHDDHTFWGCDSILTYAKGADAAVSMCMANVAELEVRLWRESYVR